VVLVEAVRVDLNRRPRTRLHATRRVGAVVWWAGQLTLGIPAAESRTGAAAPIDNDPSASTPSASTDISAPTDVSAPTDTSASTDVSVTADASSRQLTSDASSLKASL
jgi:hypothetical protein